MPDFRSFQFDRCIARKPGKSIADGLRAGSQADPDPVRFAQQHDDYVAALMTAGVEVTTLPELESFPDSVFVEDAALCCGGTAIVLKPGAPSRAGEADAIEPALREQFRNVYKLQGDGHVDGGDILLTESEALIGLSARTDPDGVEELRPILEDLGYPVRMVDTPATVLHFKSDCGLLDQRTVFSTARLAASGCFAGYDVIECPAGEEEAANLIRVNGLVIMRTGFPRTRALLEQHGYQVKPVNVDQAALVDGGLSCMSLRFHTDG
jgi:dimethylargininase